jgi:HIV Tat-specific factor 1
VIRLDKFTGAPKIKVYQDESGQCKGDALVSYMNSESLSLAVTMLDKQEIEKGHIIHLEPVSLKPRPSSSRKASTKQENVLKLIKSS